jgi:UDP-glucose-4-epimerase GalE
MQDILVVGGAGYIGSYMCKYLSRKGYRPVVLDSLERGHRAAARWGELYEGCLSDADLLGHIFSRRDIAAVMHFAAYCYVGESVEKPTMYYRNNVANTLSLLDAMEKNGVRRFIFSSSCATYGEPVETPMTEDHPQHPINPYGRTKLMVEWMLKDFQRASGFNFTALRYFNAAGADPDGELGEDHRPESHIIPIVLQTALGQRDQAAVFGDDYPTPDGSCIRDYIHIDDLAQAHALALERLLNDDPGGVYNLGNGEGYSVKEVIDAARRVTGRPIPSRMADRRPGDPAVLIGSSDLAMKELGWRPRFDDLETIIETAWRWHRDHPEGYENEA